MVKRRSFVWVGMVSRSLEKMMLIAVGLTAVVIVGVPVLLYSINTLNATTRLALANEAASELLNATDLVDSGAVNSTTVYIQVPTGVTIVAEGNTLTVTFTAPDGSPTVWTDTFSHAIDMDPVTHAGYFMVEIEMIAGAIVIDVAEIVPS